MSKKNKNKQPFSKPQAVSRPASAQPRGPLFSRRGKMLMLAGAVTAALGFFLVTLTDPAGQNWASRLCPFVILGGYALVGLGIIWPDPAPDAAVSAPLPPSAS
jgi:hypothetical protein